jgi:hypothetical protein
MADNDVTLGKIIPPDRPVARDAVHVAVLPVTADQDLMAGEHVGLRNGRASRRFQPHIGIVDPFLRDVVMIDRRCYVCLYPGTVTGMRHHWSHPTVEDVVPLPAPMAAAVTGADLPPMVPATRPPSLSRSQPRWRTETVLRLCEQMRQDDDYAALPALADALEEAEYTAIADNPITVNDLRHPYMPKVQAQRLVAILYSPETAMAVEAMDRLVDRMQTDAWEESRGKIDYAFLMAAGDRWLDAEQYTVEEGGISWSQALYGMHEQYWAAYYAITGRTPEDQHDVPFTCHC